MSQVSYTEYTCAFCCKKERNSNHTTPDGWLRHVTNPWDRNYKYHYICEDCLASIDKTREMVLGGKLLSAAARILKVPLEQILEFVRQVQRM